MKKNLSKIYTIAVIIALIILGAWSAWDIYRLRTSNSEAAQINIKEIQGKVESGLSGEMPQYDDRFKEMIRELFRENPDLEILTVYSNDPEMGIGYYFGRGEEVELLNTSETSPLTMKDLPEYKYNQLMKTKLTNPLRVQGQTGLELDLIYKVVDRTTVYNILIRLLIVVVVLFFTTLFMIFTVSRKTVEEDSVSDDFEEKHETSEDDMSLDWDQSGFDDGSENLSLDDEEFSDLNLNDTGGEFEDLNLDDVSDDFGADLSDELNLQESADDFGADFSDELNLEEPAGDFGTDLSDELNLDDLSDDFGTDLSDELNLDDVSDDFGTELSDGLNLDDVSDDFGADLSDGLNLDEPADDFGSDISDELNLDEISDDDLNFDDLDLDSDIPEEEDLLAMDHEITPSGDMDDFDFDDVSDTFTEDETDSQEPSLYSPKSGVGWESFIEERVNLELERSASEDQDLVMGLIQCDSLTDDNYRIFADQLKEDFNYPDMIFEYKEKGFALIVPHNDLDEAMNTLEAFTGREQEEYGEIKVGISSRNGRLITGSRIFMEAENALQKAIDDSEKNIVGFRSDPEKFREFLSNK